MKDTPNMSDEELEQDICKAFFGKTTQELDMNQVEKFLDVRDIVMPLIKQRDALRDKELIDYVIGKNFLTYGVENEANEFSPDEYANMAVNNEKHNQWQRAAKWLKGER